MLALGLMSLPSLLLLDYTAHLLANLSYQSQQSLPLLNYLLFGPLFFLGSLHFLRARKKATQILDHFLMVLAAHPLYLLSFDEVNPSLGVIVSLWLLLGGYFILLGWIKDRKSRPYSL
jgi:hypothetical protein